MGDYVIYNGSLYRCITKITTAEAWTPAHWVQVSVGEDLSKAVWNEVQNLTVAQQSAARNNIKAADEVTVAFHSTQISDLETGKQDKLTFDSTPTAGSNNPVTSAGIKTVTDALAGDVDDLKSALKDVKNTVLGDYYVPQLILGKLTLAADGTPTYQTNRKYGAITPNGNDAYFTAGQKIGLTSYTLSDGVALRYFVSPSDGNGKYPSWSGWMTREYTIPTTGYYCINIQTNPTTDQTSATVFSDLFYVDDPASMENAIAKNTADIAVVSERYDALEDNIQATSDNFNEIVASDYPLNKNGYYNISRQKFMFGESTRVCFAEPVKTNRIRVSVADGERYFIVCFNKVGTSGNPDNDYEYKSHFDWQTKSNTFSFDDSTYVFCFVSKTNNQDILPGNINTVALRYSDYFERYLLNGCLFETPKFYKNQYYNLSSHQFKSAGTRASIIEPIKVCFAHIEIGASEKYFVVEFEKTGNTGELNNDFTVKNSYGWVTVSKDYLFENDSYVYVFAAKTDDSAVSPAEIKTIVSVVSSDIGLMVSQRISNAIEGNDVPYYYKSHIAEKASLINAMAKTVGPNGDNFVFITDTHWGHNGKNSPALIDYIMKNTPVDWVYHGGDFLANRETGLEDHYKAFRAINNMITIRGNHDKNLNARDPTDIISDNAFYGIIVHPFEEKVNINRELYWYRDNNAEKVRYLFLDTGKGDDILSVEQLSWLKNSLVSLSNGWNALIFMHICLATRKGESDNISTIGPNGISVRNAISDIYDQLNCKVIGIVCGHIHADGWIIDPVLNYPIIATSCDACGEVRTMYDAVNDTAQLGTTTEQLFDVMFLDFASNEWNMIRVGEGSNRYLHCQQINISGTETIIPTHISGTITWYMGNEDTTVATVSNGIVTPVSSGVAIVIAKDSNGNKEAWNIRVN